LAFLSFQEEEDVREITTFYLTAYGSPAECGISHLDSINSFSNRQNNLADVFAALHQFVRFGGI
jgi:hypothetical protein